MSTPTVGLIGLGCLGRPIAGRLASQGFALIVYNRTREKSRAIEARGARVASSPSEVAEKSEVLITVVSDDEALEEVCFGSNGVITAMQPGSTHLEMSTVSQAMSKRLAQALEAKGARFLDTPVLGSGPQATDGTLLIMVGGRREVLDDNRPVLDALGQKIVHTGDVGSASQMKLVANQFITSMMVGFAQGMALAQKAGLSPSMVMEIIDASALRSPFYSGKTKRVLSRDYTPNFPLKWLLKDIHLVLEAGAELGVPLPAVAAAREIYVAAMSQGLGDLDYSAVVETFYRWSGLETDD
jgi:3-hydroxyisobutyrate dehydrogenase-like beta-hydroxyacid dehydrogenase